MNTLTLNINALDKSMQKDFRKVFATFRGKGTVRQMRSVLIWGKAMTVIMTAITTLFVIGLGALFVPLLLIAPVCLFVVPWKIRKSNAMWDALLPEHRADAVVVMA